MSGWGLSPWGLGPWGLGSATLSIVSALAVSEREVIITLASAPMAVSTIGVGDALNPRTWTVENGDTGFEFVTLSVKQLSPTVYEIYLLQKLGSYLVTHTVSAPGMIDPSGGLIGPPSSYDFFGCEAVELSSTKVGLVDLKNPMTDPTSLSGTLVVGTDGDYDTESGVELLRKLLIRRLITTPGQWFYFTGYGLGIRVQEPLRFTDKNSLRAEVQRQVQQEPELTAARVSVQTDARQGIVTFIVDARLRRSNKQITLAIPASVTTAVVL